MTDAGGDGACVPIRKDDDEHSNSPSSCIADLFPGFKAPPFKGQGTQRFPPGLDQVQVRRIRWLENKLPTRMLQGKQQDIGRSMHRQIIQDRVDALDALGNPLLNGIEKIDPVLRRSPIIGKSQSLSSSRLKGSKDGALSPASIINFLSGPPSAFGSCGSGRG